MGSIEPYPTAKGRRYRVHDPDNHSPEKAGFLRKVDAEEYLAEITGSALRGDWIDPKSAKADLGTLARDWLASRSNLKPASLNPLEISWRTHVAPV